MGRNKEVDAWFKTYDNPMKPVVQRIRQLVLGADRRIDECIKWQAPTFTYEGNLASFFPKSKSHASLMFHQGAKIPGKHRRLEGTGATSRVMKLESVAAANAAKKDIERIVKAWCDWREETLAAKKSKKRNAPSTKPGNKKAGSAKKSAKKTTKRSANKAAKKTTKRSATKSGTKSTRRATKSAAKPASGKVAKRTAKKATKRAAKKRR